MTILAPGSARGTRDVPTFAAAEAAAIKNSPRANVVAAASAAAHRDHAPKPAQSAGPSLLSEPSRATSSAAQNNVNRGNPNFSLTKRRRFASSVRVRVFASSFDVSPRATAMSARIASMDAGSAAMNASTN